MQVEPQPVVAARLVERLTELELVELHNGDIRLTPEGETYALNVLRAHRLWERYLAEKTGFAESEWHERADWAEHTQRLPVYERDGWSAGFDASILQWQGGDPDEWGDFRFTNDTGGYLLVQAWTDYPYLFVEIYGNDDGRTVDISDASVWEDISVPADLEVVDASLPAGTMMQTEWPRMPAEAIFVMTVTYADGTTKEQEFSSYYEGNGNVWTVSPDMAGSSPAAWNG